MAQEHFTVHQLQAVHDQAAVELAVAREGRIDPMVAPDRPDHWAVYLPVFVASDLAADNVTGAQNQVRFWLNRIAPDGRVPHMVVDTSGWRRQHIDRRVQMAERLENLEQDVWISPFSGPPVLSSSALQVAQALPKAQQADWAREILPTLLAVKDYQYRERDVFGDGLPVQIHPDEVLLRAGHLSEAVLSRLPSSKLTDLGRLPMLPFPDRELRTHTLSWATARRNHFNARELAQSTGRGGEPDGYIVQDPAITGMLLADNQALVELVHLAGQDLPKHIQAGIARTEANAANLHWDETTGKFAGRLPQPEILLPHVTGMESYLMLLSLGGVALQQAQIDQTIQAALTAERRSALVIPTADIGISRDARALDRGAFSPQKIVGLYRALQFYEGHLEAALLRQDIGRSILRAYMRDDVPARQYDSKTGQPLFKHPEGSKKKEQEAWRLTAAAALVVSRDLLSK